MPCGVAVREVVGGQVEHVGALRHPPVIRLRSGGVTKKNSYDRHVATSSSAGADPRRCPDDPRSVRPAASGTALDRTGRCTSPGRSRPWERPAESTTLIGMPGRDPCQMLGAEPGLHRLRRPDVVQDRAGVRLRRAGRGDVGGEDVVLGIDRAPGQRHPMLTAVGRAASGGADARRGFATESHRRRARRWLRGA